MKLNMKLDRIVTLYIDDTSVRLLVTQGTRIKKWAELPLEPGLVKGSLVVQEAEVAKRIKEFLQAQKVSAKKVNVGFSGLHSITRPFILAQMSRAVLAEAVVKEAKKLLPVPLEQLYLAWQAEPVPGERKLLIFLAATPRNIIDALLRTLHQAELKPYLLDLKPLALCRLVSKPTAIVVDAQATEFDIIIMVDGIPQPIRTVPFPDRALSWSEKLPMIMDDLERTINFHNSTNPDKLLEHDVPIYVSGDLEKEPEFDRSVLSDLGHPVMTLTSPLKCPKVLDPNRYLVNIGLAMKEASLTTVASPATNLNALPVAYQPKPFSMMNVAFIPAAAVAVAVLVPMILFVRSASANIDSARSNLDTTNEFLRQKQAQEQQLKKDITGLQGQVAKVEVANKDFAILANSFGISQELVNGNLKVSVDAIGINVELKGIEQDNERLTLKGWAPSDDDVLAYGRAVAGSSRFGEAVVARLSDAKGGGTDFVLVFKK